MKAKLSKDTVLLCFVRTSLFQAPRPCSHFQFKRQDVCVTRLMVKSF